MQTGVNVLYLFLVPGQPKLLAAVFMGWVKVHRALQTYPSLPPTITCGLSDMSSLITVFSFVFSPSPRSSGLEGKRE